MEWTEEDKRSVEKASSSREQKSRYEVRLDKINQKILAYIPAGGEAGRVFIARAVFPLANIRDAWRSSWGSLVGIWFFIFATGFLIDRGLSRSLVTPIHMLNAASQKIMEGHLGERVEIHSGDEMEVLAHTFNHMSESLKHMKEMAEDANPLTQLPGNQGILREIKKRILEKQKFVLFHVDLDRFKVFNDHFGLARGDEAIKRTADVLKSAVREKGAEDDFVGHQGGDDFVIVTKANHAKAVADFVINQFNKEVVPALYRKDDLERGYTLQIDRRRLAETGEERLAQFPLLAVSLAGVSNVKKDFADYFACMAAAVEVKKEVKKTIESSCLIKE